MMTNLNMIFVFCFLLFINCYKSFGKEISNQVFLCSPEAPPYSGAHLKSGGPLTELIIKALNLSGFNVTVRFAPWVRIVKDAKNDKCIVLGLWSTENRKKSFHFSQSPIVNQSLGLFVNSNNLPIKKNKGILAIERFSYVAKTLNLENFTVYEVTSIQQGLDMLVKSRIDVLYGEIGHINHLINLNEQLKDKIKIIPPLLETKLGYLSIAKSYPNAESILKLFDENLEQTIAESNILNESWLPKQGR